jgi:hypothetical protein
MKTTINNNTVDYTIKTMVFGQIVVTISWGNESQAYCNYNYLFGQGVVPNGEITDEMIKKIRKFCEKKELTLWSY